MALNQAILRAQPGKQESFLACRAEIALYGGGAGGGKTFALLMEPTRHIANPLFRSIIFRRKTTEIRNPGGLWDESLKIYYGLQGRPRETFLDWVFPSGFIHKFAHLEYEKNIHDYQGSQIPFIGFDEANQFTWRMVSYMFSRNRSMSGVRGYMRMTCNPDPDSWIRPFIDWWIDDKGFAIEERSGIIRYFAVISDKVEWAGKKEELEKKFGAECSPKSFTFIPSSVYDNKILLEKDPGYLANLKNMSLLDRSRLLERNWNIRPSAGVFFKRRYFEVVDAAPSAREIVKVVRAWDHAATEVDEASAPDSSGKDPDWTVGVKMAMTKDGLFYILDMVRHRLSSFGVERLTYNTASQDGINTKIKIFQDPGSAGVYEADAYIRLLAGYEIECEKIITNKVGAAKPLSAQAERGNVKVLRGDWNERFFLELENFPDGAHDDIVDSTSAAFNALNADKTGNFSKEFVPQSQKPKMEW